MSGPDDQIPVRGRKGHVGLYIVIKFLTGDGRNPFRFFTFVNLVAVSFQIIQDLHHTGNGAGHLEINTQFLDRR